MKVSLIYRVNVEVPENMGVILKMDGQQKAFIELGYECAAYYHRDGEIVKRDYEGKEEVITTVTYRKRSFSFKDFFNTLTTIAEIGTSDLIYIRYPFSTPAFLNFVKGFRKEQVVIEMPTYPYVKEWTGITKVFLSVDKFYSGKLKDYCKSIVHFGKEKQIFGIDTIHSSNGINTSSFPLVQNDHVFGLKMIAVGKFNYWHGLDRLIKGMAVDIHKDVELKIVGDGPVISSLRLLVESLKLDANIVFCGVKKGKELDALFNESNLGIGTLGIHRKEVEINSSLKHREYASRGLPFIYAGNDPDFTNYKWAHSFTGTEDDIPISEVWKVVQENKTKGVEIKKYSKEYLDWKVKLSKILDHLS